MKDIEIEEKITYCSDKKVRERAWYIKGTRIHHREDGPAITFYMYHKLQLAEDHNLERIEKWYFNGHIHRRYAPAVIVYSGDDIILMDWFHYGENFTTKANEVIQSMHLPLDFNKWTDEEKLIFKMIVE